MAGVPGAGGPVPKRESQRRRNNKGAAVDHAVSDGQIRGPELMGEHSEVGARFWANLRTSGQAQFFEDSDWSAAELVVLAIDQFVKKPSAMMLGAIQSGMSPLMVTEGDRRRLRVELEKAKPSEGGDGDVAWLDTARRRRSG